MLFFRTCDGWTGTDDAPGGEGGERVGGVGVCLCNFQNHQIFFNLKKENLRELRLMFEEGLKWVLDNDIQVEKEKEGGGGDGGESVEWDLAKWWRDEAEAIRVLVDRLSEGDVTVKNWKFVRIMKQSGLQFIKGQLLKIVEGLRWKARWRPAMSVVDWVYGCKNQADLKSR